MLTTILLSLLGAIIYAVLGTLWYSMATPMGRLHMRYLGFDKLSPEEQKQKIDAAKPHMWKTYLAQIALAFLTSFFTVFVVTLSLKNGVSAAIAISFPVFAWLCFSAPAIGSQILFGNVDRAIACKKFFSDTVFILIVVFIIALIASLCV